MVCFIIYHFLSNNSSVQGKGSIPDPKKETPAKLYLSQNHIFDYQQATLYEGLMQGSFAEVSESGQTTRTSKTSSADPPPLSTIPSDLICLFRPHTPSRRRTNYPDESQRLTDSFHNVHYCQRPLSADQESPCSHHTPP